MIDGESLPNICEPREWYQIKMFPNPSNREEEITYSTHAKQLKKVKFFNLGF
jgi:hypothetical protein